MKKSIDTTSWHKETIKKLLSSLSNGHLLLGMKITLKRSCKTLLDITKFHLQVVIN